MENCRLLVSAGFDYEKGDYDDDYDDYDDDDDYNGDGNDDYLCRLVVSAGFAVEARGLGAHEGGNLPNTMMLMMVMVIVMMIMVKITIRLIFTVEPVIETAPKSVLEVRSINGRV